MGSDGAGRSLGQLKATGLRPQLTERLADRGVNIDPVIFEPEVELRGRAGLGQSTVQPPRINGWPR